MRAAALPLLLLLEPPDLATPPAAKRGTSLVAVAISPSTISVTVSITSFVPLMSCLPNCTRETPTDDSGAPAAAPAPAAADPAPPLPLSACGVELPSEIRERRVPCCCCCCSGRAICCGRCCTTSTALWASASTSCVNALSSDFQSVCCTLLTTSFADCLTAEVTAVATFHRLPRPMPMPAAGPVVEPASSDPNSLLS
eukprot:GHRQ01017764.1.p1 GENE.GHRQ01017764.1~~GHRQ01017764.1.p1  ORF type:complete len:198 (-),score=25.54 GHRQ01017764.1:54-647(-)